MKNKFMGMALIIGITTIMPLIAIAQNPIIQTLYSTDPAPMVYNDTLYLYTGHDEDNTTNFV